MNKYTTDQLTTALIILFLIVFTELTVFNNGGAFLLIITGFLFYFSFKKRKRALFWIGCFFAFLAVMAVLTLRLFVIAILIYMLYKQYKKPQDDIIVSGDAFDKGSIHKNDFIGITSPPLEAYKWQDVQIQRFLGDITIDTTQTILPNGTSVISIRQAIGKVTVVVPYDIPFRLQYTTILGEVKLPQKPSKRLMNEHIVVEDGEPVEAKRKLVIHVATWLGDVEVVRQ